MTPEELELAVKRMGTKRAFEVADIMEELMPTLLQTKAGQRTVAFIHALRQEAQRAERRGSIGTRE